MHVSRRLLNVLSRQSDYAILWPRQPAIIPGAPIDNLEHRRERLDAAPTIDGDPLFNDDSVVLLSEYIMAPARKPQADHELAYLSAFRGLQNTIRKNRIEVEHVEEPRQEWAMQHGGLLRVVDRNVGTETYSPQHIVTYHLHNQPVPDAKVFAPLGPDTAISLEEMLWQQTLINDDETQQFPIHHLMRIYLYPDIEYAANVLAGKANPRHWPLRTIGARPLS
jgi:hypothetical protein